MNEENRIGTYQFVAEPFHVDFNGRLTMGVLGNHLLNCAGFHANDRGFGIATLNEDNYTWVLSRLAIELDEMPYQINYAVRTPECTHSGLGSSVFARRYSQNHLLFSLPPAT